MKIFRKVFQKAQRSEFDWGLARLTANHFGLALLVTGWFSGFVEGNPDYHKFVWFGATFVFVSLARSKRAFARRKTARRKP